MEKNTIICDHCKKEHEARPLFPIRSDEPATLYVAKKDGSPRKQYHFCDIECIREWAILVTCK